jgi:hypothetical protein
VHGLNSRDNRDLLAELQECLARLEMDRVAKAEELAVLVADISKVLVDLGLAPIHGIP